MHKLHEPVEEENQQNRAAGSAGQQWVEVEMVLYLMLILRSMQPDARCKCLSEGKKSALSASVNSVSIVFIITFDLFSAFSELFSVIHLFLFSHSEAPGLVTQTIYSTSLKKYIYNSCITVGFCTKCKGKFIFLLQQSNSYTDQWRGSIHFRPDT